jgi:hypothetical protein
MVYAGYVALGVILLVAVWIIFGSKKVRWYKVYLTNNDIMLLKRNSKERLWRTSDRYMRFLDEFDREYTFYDGAHWILFTIEVKEDEFDIAKQEIAQEKKEIAEKMGA